MTLPPAPSLGDGGPTQHRPLLSPSIVGTHEGKATAFELKFLLDGARAGEVLAWARGQLRPDPHGDPARGGAYQTTTLYCDTANWQVYWRAPTYRRRKFRLRRYGAEELVYLERKTRRADRVAKLRTVAALGELPLLAAPPGPDWPCGWFHRQLTARQLRPALLVSYDRVALIGEAAEGSLRLTFDRELHGRPWHGWELPAAWDGAAFLRGQVICEMKFRTALPPLFKELMARFKLAPSKASKYRHGVAACGIDPGAAGGPQGT